METRKFNPMYLVMNQVQKGKVPATSKVWAKPLSEYDSQPLASWAANEGFLPDGFGQWEIYDENRDHCVAAIAAGAGTLPDDFNRWDLPGVAHEAAHFGNLPEGFSQWGITVGDGWTVAHEAALCGYLPAGFALWHLADNNGDTVAHVAARQVHLPVPDFTRWALADKYGRTVAHEAAKAGYRRNEIPEEFWSLRSNDGDTVEDVMREYDKFIEECAADYMRRGEKKENA